VWCKQWFNYTSGVGVGQKIRLRLPVLLRIRLHPKTSDSLRHRHRSPGANQSKRRNCFRFIPRPCSLLKKSASETLYATLFSAFICWSSDAYELLARFLRKAKNSHWSCVWKFSRVPHAHTFAPSSKGQDAWKLSCHNRKAWARRSFYQVKNDSESNYWKLLSVLLVQGRNVLPAATEKQTETRRCIGW